LGYDRLDLVKCFVKERFAMKKKHLLLTLFVGGMVNAFAYPGYVSDSYSQVVRTLATGSCVHTAYFNKEEDGLVQCGEAQPAAPVSVAPTYVTVTMSDSDHVLFNFDKATLTPEGKNAINDFAHKIDHQQSVTSITVNGYTDAIGAKNYNLKLSQARANTIKNLLIEDGYSADKVIATGYGDQDATASSACFNQYGKDQHHQIIVLEHKIKSMASGKAKHQMLSKLSKLKSNYADLIKCTAPDRKVVFKIEYTAKQQAMSDQNSSAPITN
jgi:outer membrane protein OmpA-like peptidoglycan-associated protein